MIFRGHLDVPVAATRRTSLADIYERAAFLAMEVEPSINLAVVEARAIAAAVREQVYYDVPPEFEEFASTMEPHFADPQAAEDAALEAFPIERFVQRHSALAGVSHFHWPWDSVAIRAARNLSKAAERERAA